jgi:hypothetical protein
MSENFTGNFEKKEQIPNLEEIKMVFEKILEETEFKEVAREEDEKGLLLFRAELEKDGEKIELEYTREGQKPKGAILYPVIYKAIYDENDFPVDGFSIRKIDGEWQGI